MTARCLEVEDTFGIPTIVYIFNKTNVSLWLLVPSFIFC